MEFVVSNQTRAAKKPLRLGFVPLCDCAPLVMACELDLFAKYELEVQLSREIGWATLRDKLCYGGLEAAHALAPLAFAVNLGLGAPATTCVTGLVLSLQGNAITLSRKLQPTTACDAASLRVRLLELGRPLILGIPFLFSAHHFLLRAWLRGLKPEHAARLVVVPPPQMPANLKAGNLDAYCVGEPWNTIAVLAGTGSIAANSCDLLPSHPEKILLVRRDFAEGRAAEHERLIAALLEACEFCAAPENEDLIVSTLARREYVNTSAASLRPFFGGVEAHGERRVGSAANLGLFFGRQVNEPSFDKAAWIVENMSEAGLAEERPAMLTLGKKIFRPDIFGRARQLQNSARNSNEQNLKRYSGAALT